MNKEYCSYLAVVALRNVLWNLTLGVFFSVRFILASPIETLSFKTAISLVVTFHLYLFSISAVVVSVQ